MSRWKCTGRRRAAAAAEKAEAMEVGLRGPPQAAAASSFSPAPNPKATKAAALLLLQAVLGVLDSTLL